MKKLMATTLIVLASLATGGVAEAQTYGPDRPVLSEQFRQDLVYQVPAPPLIAPGKTLVKTCIGQPGAFQSKAAVQQYILTSGGLRTAIPFC